MYKVNSLVKVKHKTLFGRAEILKGNLIAIRNFQGEDSEGYPYSLKSYHIILENGKRIIVMDKTAHPPYLKSYTLLQ